MKEKVSLTLDKHTWHPSPLPGAIVLITTLNSDGVSNVAPKSWISMMAFEPPILALGCNLEHWTARNILARKEFVVNVPGAELIEIVWQSHVLPHPRSVEALGLTPRTPLVVQPPLIEECKAHLECVLDRYLTYGCEVILLGQIVAVSIDAEARAIDDPYSYLEVPFFLEDRAYGVIERARWLRQVER
jgi:flavin reductase (DIM6/NTAB) family NADH-FMN oxidoreductase RutF